MVYGAVAKTRRIVYEKGLKKTDRLPVPVISIGNLTVGGVGKTPCGLAIARMLRGHGYKPAVLLRGYKRRSTEPLVLLPERFDPARVMEYGDEAALYCLNAGIPVGIGSSRFEIGKRLLQQTPCDVFLLDDGFQHYQLYRDIDLVLLDGDRPFGNGRCLPYGPLREPISVLRTASALIHRGERFALTEFFSKPHFHGPLYWTGLMPFLSWSRGEANGLVPIDSFAPRSVALLSGIGDPARLQRQAEDLGFTIERHWAFPDHHWFSQGDLRSIAGSTAAPIFLTEKDAVRLLPLLGSDELPWDRFYVIQAAWRFSEAENFESWLLAQLPKPLFVR